MSYCHRQLECGRDFARGLREVGRRVAASKYVNRSAGRRSARKPILRASHFRRTAARRTCAQRPAYFREWNPLRHDVHGRHALLSPRSLDRLRSDLCDHYVGTVSLTLQFPRRPRRRKSSRRSACNARPALRRDLKWRSTAGILGLLQRVERRLRGDLLGKPEWQRTRALLVQGRK